MKRPVEIKICGMTREADVDLALSLGADYIGFIVYPKSPRALSLARAVELAARVPPGRRVVVDVEPRTEDLLRYREAGFDAFQVHGKQSLEAERLVAWSALVGKERLWLAPRLSPEEPFPELVLAYADTILLDTYSKAQVGGTGETGDWGRFPEIKASYPDRRFILAGGLTPQNVLAAIEATGTDHVDVNSGVESEPGKKDPEKLRSLFRVLRG